MPRVVIITINDNYCYGARMLVSYLSHLDHEVYLVVSNNLKNLFIPYADVNTLNLAKRPGVLFVEREDIGGMYCCPFTDPVSPKEKKLLLELIKEISPDIVAFSLTSVDTILARELARLIKKSFRNINVICGGIYPTLSPEECLTYADAVCLGEGEEAFAEKYKQKFTTSFGGYAHPRLSTREMFRALKSAGMLFVAFGVQSGSERILKIYNRRYNPEEMFKGASEAVEEGLKVC